MDSLILGTLIKKLNIIPVGKGDVTGKTDMFHAQLKQMGYNVVNPEELNDSVLDNYSPIINLLNEYKGGDKNYVPLFKGFPNEVPDEAEYNLRRLIGYMKFFIDNPDQITKAKRDWNSVDFDKVSEEYTDLLFEKDAFGADPITQMQTETLYKKGVLDQLERSGDTNVEYHDLKALPYDEAKQELIDWVKQNVYSKTSIKEDIKDGLSALIKKLNITINSDKVVFKENLNFVFDVVMDSSDDDWFGSKKGLRDVLNTPTDVLRFFAYLTESDVTLQENINFPKLSRPNRTFIMSILSETTNLREDLNRYRGLWIAIANMLHTGEYKDKFPAVYYAFQDLRDDNIMSFDAKIDKDIEGEYWVELVQLLKQRPTVFARKLNRVLQVTPNDFSGYVMTEFDRVIRDIPNKVIIELIHFFKLMDDKDYRFIINKYGKPMCIENDLKGALTPPAKNLVLETLKSAICKKIRVDKEPLEGNKYYIDECLLHYVVPFKMRKQSEGTLTVGRGTRFHLDQDDQEKVLRLFLWWKEQGTRTDYDLSIIGYKDGSEGLSKEFQVSYTNLSAYGITHSGDLQSAPNGASEFIDIPLNKLPECDYITMQVFNFSGSAFSEIEAHAGWMLRDEVSNDHKSFDPSTVKSKVDINGNGSTVLPLIYDVNHQDIVYADLYINPDDRRYNRVENMHESINNIMKGVLQLAYTKPNIYNLVEYNVVGSGAELVDDPEDADVTVGLSLNDDYNVYQTQKLITEFL